MEWSVLFVLLQFIFVCGYSALLVYYGLGSVICPDPVWRAFSKQMLPGITLALMLSLLLVAVHQLSVVLGYTTIWWPNVPVF